MARIGGCCGNTRQQQLMSKLAKRGSILVPGVSVHPPPLLPDSLTDSMSIRIKTLEGRLVLVCALFVLALLKVPESVWRVCLCVCHVVT